MAWVQATKTAKQPAAGITAWQVLRWTVLLVLVLAVVVGVFLVMRRRRTPVAALAGVEGMDAAAVPVEGIVTPPDLTTPPPPPAEPPAEPPAKS